MSHIIHLALPLFTHTEVLWKNYPNIILLFIEILRKGAYYIGQPSCLDKWHTFRRNKQYFFIHEPPSFRTGRHSLVVQSFTLIKNYTAFFV